MSVSLCTDGGDGGDDLAQLEFVENGGFPGCVQAHHQDPHLLLPEEAFKEIRKDIPHPLRSDWDKRQREMSSIPSLKY